MFAHLMARWRDLFNADFDVLLYDLTSNYFEINASDVPEGDKRRHDYSRDKWPDCPQMVIALVVTPDGLPPAYEVLPDNTHLLPALGNLAVWLNSKPSDMRRTNVSIPYQPVWASSQVCIWR